MDSINNKNLIYISVAKLAQILNCARNTIKNRCNSGKYQYRLVDGNGGKQYEILVSSLDEEIKAKLFTYQEAQYPTRNYIDNTQEPLFPLAISSKEQETLITFGLVNNKSNENYTIPESAKKLALFKVDLIVLWQNYRDCATSKTNADKEFVKLYNSKSYNPYLYEQIGKISIRTLQRWNKNYLEANKDWKALVNNYSYGCESQLITDLSDIEKYYLLKYMLHQNKFNLGKAYELICIELKAKGFNKICSLSSYRRVWQYVIANHAEMVAFSRGGMKSALDTELPHITKDLTKLNVGDVIVGDGHTLDFMVLNPLTNKPCRATLVGFEDEASRDLIGYDIMITENTQVIASALRHAIINLGKMPKIVHLDNGRAFKGKTFTGSKADFASSGIQGLYAKLGIKTTFSKPYNGRAKNIERFFNEFTGSLAKLMPSYIGNNIQNQPASTKRNEKFHKIIQGSYVPTIEETKAIIDEWLNKVYRQRRALNAPDKTIAQYVEAGKGKGIDIDLLDDLMLVSEERCIHKGAVQLFKTWYYSDKMVGLSQKVVAKYDMFDLSYLKIFSLKGEFICRAERQESIHPYAELLGTAKDLADFKQKIKANQILKKERVNTIKTALKSLYKKDGYDLAKVTKAKQIEYKEDFENKKQYKIDFAENVNILADREAENVYKIDNLNVDILNEKQYKI